MTIKALKTRVIFTKQAAEKITTSGIVLSAPEQEANPYGVIVDIGPDVEVTHDLAVGREIVVNWQFVSQMDHNGEKYYVVDQHNILAVVEQ